MFSLAERSGEGEEGFFDRLEEIVVDGARQLDSMIGMIRAGRLTQLGIEPRHVREIFPLVISLQEVVVSRPLRSWMDMRLEN